MLNRRILRVKVLQALYAFDQNEKLTPKGLAANLDRSINAIGFYYAYHLYIIQEIANYIIKYNTMQEGKFLTKNLHPVLLLENPIIVAIKNDTKLQEKFAKEKFELYADDEFIRQLFYHLLKNQTYKSYITAPERNLNLETEVIKVLFLEILCQSEVFEAHLEEIGTTWHEDDEIVLTAIGNKLTSFAKTKVKRSNENSGNNAFFSDMLQNWDEKTTFAHELLQKTITHRNNFIELIKPRLENWELDRIAKLDLLKLQLALCELVHFSAIPVNVTLNEYIEITKFYSTPKSKDFVNGILDVLLKQLQTSGIIKKLGRGLDQ